MSQTMTSLFFISSSGSMATHWLSKVLSSSSSIKCFHGSNGLQKHYNANLDSLSVLHLLSQWASNNRRPFVGVNHLSKNHGTVGFQACMSLRVPFCALVRNPILATDSQFQQRNKSETLSPTKHAGYKAMVDSIKGMDVLVDVTDRLEILFFRCAESVISHLSDIESSDCEFFKFEDYTNDYGELRRLVQLITKDYLQDDHQINMAFSTIGKTNAHRIVKPDTQTTWNTSWSSKQKEVFTKIWQFYDDRRPRQRPIYPEIEGLWA